MPQGPLPLPIELLGGDAALLEEALQTLIDDGAETNMPELAGRELVDELSELEDFIDENGLRGAPLAVLKDFGGALKSNPQTRRELAQIAAECEAEDLLDALSPELYFLLFARKQKKNPR